jgi:hypothetical protein
LNLEYYVKHTLEFQRLVAQIDSTSSRKLFLNLIYTYYYPDILLAMKNISNDENNKNEEKEKLFENINDNKKSSDELKINFFNNLKNKKQESNNEINFNNVDYKKLNLIYK